MAATFYTEDAESHTVSTTIRIEAITAHTEAKACHVATVISHIADLVAHVLASTLCTSVVKAHMLAVVAPT